MISVAHAAMGAYIAATFPHPLVYIPLSLASHFALDFVRHYDIGVAMKIYHFSRVRGLCYEAVDLVAAVLIIALIWRQAPPNFNLHLWIGALAGIFPDIIEASNFFFHQPCWLFKPFYAAHQLFHHSTKDFWWGIIPQIILVSIIALAANWS